MTSPRDGWTLAELLVVVAIFGVLSGLLLPAAGAVLRFARRTDARGERSDQFAVVLDRGEHGPAALRVPYVPQPHRYATAPSRPIPRTR